MIEAYKLLGNQSAFLWAQKGGRAAKLRGWRAAGRALGGGGGVRASFQGSLPGLYYTSSWDVDQWH